MTETDTKRYKWYSELMVYQNPLKKKINSLSRKKRNKKTKSKISETKEEKWEKLNCDSHIRLGKEKAEARNSVTRIGDSYQVKGRSVLKAIRKR